MLPKTDIRSTASASTASERVSTAFSLASVTDMSNTGSLPNLHVSTALYSLYVKTDGCPGSTGEKPREASRQRSAIRQHGRRSG